MLRLRKILLCDYVFYSIFFLTICLIGIRLLIPKTSIYSENDTYLEGRIIKITKKEYGTMYEIKAKEKALAISTKQHNFQLGDIVVIKGTFKKPQKNTTEGLFNYQDYLNKKEIYYIVTIETIHLKQKNKNILFKVKQIIINSFHQNSYLYTFLLGDKSLLKQDIINSYQENGISHLFAISGMHITILSSILEKILKKFYQEETRYKIISVFLIIYLCFVGFSPSVVRGVLFYILFTGNSIYYFYIKKENLFILVLSIALLMSPNNVYDIGFQYSYCISYALLKMSRELSSKSYILSLLKTSILSFIVSIPITIKNYYQLNILSILYNLFFVPYVSILVFPMTLIVSIFKPLLPLYQIMIFFLEQISLFLSRISLGKIIFQKVPSIIYVLYFILIFVYLNTKKKTILIVFILLLGIHLVISTINQSISVSALDVGQGDSVLLHIKNKSILIDTGGNKYKTGKIVSNTIKPYLKMNGISHIDFLILSHGDYDHMGEAINLVNNFKVEKVIFNCGPYNDLEKELIKVLNKKNIKYYSCIKELNIDNNKLYFLQTKKYDNENDNSNVIYTELNGYKFMFMGDAGVTTEKAILDKYNLQDIDVLKVGHHGSKTSSSKDFINEINPKYSIISVGKNNRYGHPNKEVLSVLENSKIYRTDQDGSVMFTVKNNKLNIETCGP